MVRSAATAAFYIYQKCVKTVVPCDRVFYFSAQSVMFYLRAVYAGSVAGPKGVNGGHLLNPKPQYQKRYLTRHTTTRTAHAPLL